MSSDASKAVLTLVGVMAALGAMDYHFLRRASASEALPQAAPLRVCADPNNLPFSNSRGEGFENALAQLIGRELGRSVQYTWWPQRRGFIRNTLKTGLCDLVMGIPAHYDMADPTAPYYRSGYVFVTRADRKLDLHSLDDPRLHQLSIGLHSIGANSATVPPAQALATRGIITNIRPYSIFGDYSQPDPPRALIDAVARGDIDVAIAWGPLGGYFAAREPVALSVTPVTDPDPRDPAMQFDIAAGVRPGDAALKAAVQQVLSVRREEVDGLLRQFHVPLMDSPGGPT